jgi:hypothetical protein
LTDVTFPRFARRASANRFHCSIVSSIAVTGARLRGPAWAGKFLVQ